MNNKYERLKSELENTGYGKMKCFGSSMKPILPNPSLCVYEKKQTYNVGDIVFCKVKGKYIDAHKITKKTPDGKCLISNNRGHDNGWTNQIFGRVIEAYDKNNNLYYVKNKE